MHNYYLLILFLDWAELGWTRP